MELKSNSDIFIKEIEERGIEFLIHFTPTLNLLSILQQNQLMSRSLLERLDIEQFDILDFVQFTDDIRFDDKRYINLSISSPNTFLFSKFMSRTDDNPTITWCVLKINPKHIYDVNTLFSVTNAASISATNQYKITGDIDKFKMLFADKLCLSTSSGTRKITRGNISKKYPTDVQAEVLVKDTIPASSIISVCFKTERELVEAKSAMSVVDISHFDNKFEVNPKIFSPNREL